MFVELGGFVNNAFSMSPSVCLLASVHSHTRNFFFVGLFVLNYRVFMDQGYQARYCVSTSM